MQKHMNAANQTNLLHNQFTAYLIVAVNRRKARYMRSKIRIVQNEGPVEIQDNFREFQTDSDILLSLPLLDQIENIKLRQVLAQARKRDLYIYLAKALENRSFVEIAAEFGIEYNTATAAYYRLRNRLRKELGGEEQ